VVPTPLLVPLAELCADPGDWLAIATRYGETRCEALVVFGYARRRFVRPGLVWYRATRQGRQALAGALWGDNEGLWTTDTGRKRLAALRAATRVYGHSDGGRRA